MRFTIYFVLSLLIFTRNINYIYVLIFIGILTACIYMYDNEENDNKKILYEKLNIEKNTHNKNTYKSTRDNPFMNVMVGDYKNFPNRPAAGSWNNTNVRDRVSKNFEIGLNRLNNDIHMKSASDRQYYTMPSTTIPNEQDDFAKWLYYKPNKTQKEINQDYYI